MAKGTTLVIEDNPPDPYYQPDTRFVRGLWTAAGFARAESLMDIWGDNSTDVRDALNEGRGFAVFRGQCIVNWYPPFDHVNPATLDNGDKLPIVVTGSCQTITLYPGQSMLGDQFVRAGDPRTRRGAVAYFGTAFTGGHISEFRSAGTRGFFAALFRDGRWHLGEACRQGKFWIDSLYPGNPDRYQEWTLLGDPELNVWTARPQALTVACETLLSTGPDTLAVLVEQRGAPVCSALVCVRDTASTYRYGYTDAGGRRSFPLNQPGAGFLQVTVTAHNALPWTDTARVAAPDCGVTGISAPPDTVDSGVVVTPCARVRNFGPFAATFPVRFRIGGVYADTETVADLPPDSTCVISFAPWRPAVLGTFLARCTSALSGDLVPGNDTLSKSVTVVVSARDVGVTAIYAPVGTVDSESVTAPRARVRNFGTSPASFPVTLRISDGYARTRTVSDLAPGSALDVDFPDWVARVRGRHTVRCSTALVGDQNPANDLLADSVRVRVRDAGVTRILRPNGGVDSGATVVPAALVHNFGTEAELIPVRFLIGSLYADDTLVALAPGESDSACLAPWIASPLGTFIIRCSTRLAGDMVAGNDRAEDSVRVRPLNAVEEPVGARLLPSAPALQSVAPNPFCGRVGVVFTLPAAQRVYLEVFSAAGRPVRTLLTGIQPAGRRRIEWDGRGADGRPAARGIYFCRMRAGDFTAERKLVKL
jgi:hypothetical protein